MFRVTFFVVCSVCSVEHVERSLRDFNRSRGIDPCVNLIFPVVSFINGCMFRFKSVMCL